MVKQLLESSITLSYKQIYLQENSNHLSLSKNSFVTFIYFRPDSVSVIISEIKYFF